jgi:hypothetical protein
MPKAKAKSGIGRGTGKKGWNRWQVGAKKANVKPYVSKGVKHAEAAKATDKDTSDNS